MRQNDYFDYDGNISSLASLVDEELLPGRASFAIPSESFDDAPVAEIKDSELPSPKNTDSRADAETSLSSDLLSAIEAFESMNLSALKTDEQGEAEPLTVTPDVQQSTEIEEAQVNNNSETVDWSDRIKKAKDKARSTAHELKELKKKEDEKEISRVKHFFIILLLFLVVIVVFTGVVYVFMQSINKENKRAAEFNKNCAEVCTDYSVRYGNPNYENLYDTFGVEGYRLTGICFVRELDFDNDGESELMVSYNKNGTYYNEVWGYSSSKDFKLLYTDVAAQKDSKKSDAYSLLYRTKNKYYIAQFDKDKLSEFSLCQLKHGKFEKKYDAEYDSKTRAYSVNKKDDTDAFEQIKYSVLKEEKASLDIDNTTNLIDSFNGSSAENNNLAESMTLENAYYQVVQEYNKRYGVSEYKEENGVAYINGLSVVELIDFDADGQNELLLVYRKTVKERKEGARGNDVTINVDKYYCDVFRYSGSRAILAYTNEGLSNKLNNSSDVYYMIRRDKKKAYYCLNSFTNSDYGKHISAVSAEYSYNGTEFSQTFKASFTTDYGYSKYAIDGKSVSKYTFNDKGYRNPFFDSERNYDKEHYRVVYVQRKKLDSSDLKSVPKETEHAIQSLNQLYSADIKQ